MEVEVRVCGVIGACNSVVEVKARVVGQVGSRPLCQNKIVSRVELGVLVRIVGYELRGVRKSECDFTRCHTGTYSVEPHE